jgi:hypothetical protein
VSRYRSNGGSAPPRKVRSEGSRDYQEPKEPKTFSRALLKAAWVSVVGLLFSVLVSLLVGFIGPLHAPAEFLQRIGTDWGMRFAANVLGGAVNGGGPHGKYAFVDVDRSACEGFSSPSSQIDCVAGHIVPVDLTLAFVRAAREAGARAIVVDVAPPEDEEQRRLLYEGIVRTGGAPVIAPLYGRPAEDGRGIRGDPSHDLIPGGRKCDRQLFLAAVSTVADEEANDGVLRHFAKGIRWFGGGSEQAQWVPTAAYLASVIGGPRRVEPLAV